MIWRGLISVPTSALEREVLEATPLNTPACHAKPSNPTDIRQLAHRGYSILTTQRYLAG